MARRQRGAAPVEDVNVNVILPADLLQEILHQFPSNHLLILKLVCKYWLRLISSPEFIHKHLQRSKAEFLEPRIVKQSRRSDEIEILGYRANTLTSKKINGKGHVRLLGSCDGLVLYMDSCDCKIGALNPSTGEIKVDARCLLQPSTENENILKHSLAVSLLQPSTENENALEHLLACTWFGRHPATGEYVLVIAGEIIGKLTRSIVFEVYSLSRNLLLSSLTEEPVSHLLSCSRDIGIFLRGRLHVQALNVESLDLKNEILAYDLEANRMLRMRAPLKQQSTLGVIDGCLCAFDRREVWMMKEYGVNESWTKYANINDNISIPLPIYSNDDVILCDDFLKAFKDREIELLKGYGYFISKRVVVCIDSLVSPAVVWEKRE